MEKIINKTAPIKSDLLTGLDTPYWQTADHKESTTVSNSSEQQKIENPRPSLLDLIVTPTVTLQIITEIDISYLQFCIILHDKDGKPLEDVLLCLSPKEAGILVNAKIDMVIQHLLKRDESVLLQQEITKEKALEIMGFAP